jgi:ubiquitin-conjugating enzyme E2 O
MGAAVKYPQFKRMNPADTHGYDLNVFTILLTKTAAKVIWQDQTEEVVAGTTVVPDYNIDDNNEVWPGEIVITNEKAQTEEDWIFQPKRVGVVQSVSPTERIAKIKWLPKAYVRYNQVGLDEHLDELSLLAGSTLGLDQVDREGDYTVEDVTLYDIRTIGALSRRRGDFVVIGSRADDQQQQEATDRPGPVYDDRQNDETSWFGEVIDLNLDGMLTVRLGAATEVKDIRISPEYTTLVHSSDMPSFMGNDSLDDPYDTGEEYEGGFDSDDGSDISEEGVWTVDGEPIEEEEEDWDTETSESDSDAEPEDVDMQDASPSAENVAHLPAITEANGITEANELDKDVDLAGTGVSDSLGIPLQESSVKIHGTEDAPPAFDVLEGGPPVTHPYSYPDPPALTGARMKRIRKEHSILSSSLPEGIFVRTWESRLDLLRVLIVGPLDTPYEYAPYVIDIRIPPDYPTAPPDAFFHSWTSGQGPVNPNLYENGKICLSLLGTWHAGEKGEAWSASRSTILQVLVSVLGLVLVKEPYYNEAGFEARTGSEDAKVPSQLYSERTYFTSRAFITHALKNGIEGFDDLLKWLYYSEEANAPQLLGKAIDAAKELIRAGESGEDIRAGLKRMSRGAIIMLERQLRQLEEQKKTAQ